VFVYRPAASTANERTVGARADVTNELRFELRNKWARISDWKCQSCGRTQVGHGQSSYELCALARQVSSGLIGPVFQRRNSLVDTFLC